MLELFVFGTFWFYALCIITYTLVSILIVDDKPIWATISIILYFTLLSWFGDINIVKYIIENPKTILIFALLYIGIGVLWSVFNYWLYIKKLKKETKEYGHSKPTFKSTISDIPIWMAFWPFGLTSKFLKNAIFKLFENISIGMTNIFKNIYNKHFED